MTDSFSIWRCPRCGIESLERTCFVDPRNGHSVAICITCHKPSGGVVGPVLGLFAAVTWPLILLAGFRGGAHLTIALVAAAILMLPALILLHELGHALMARLLGLEVPLIIIGKGPLVWSGNFLGTAFSIHALPQTGLTLLGSRSLRYLRLRMWITTLMGPATNAILVAVTVLYWDTLVHLFGTDVLIVWCLFNFLVGVGNLWPRRFTRAGQLYQSDGWQLLTIPFLRSTELEILRTSPDLIAAAMYYDAREYVKARDAAMRGRMKSPHHPQLAVLQSACQLQLGEFAEAKNLLESIAEPAECALSAVVWNNLALALWLSSPASMEAIAHAEALSNRSFSSYPCLLAYRSTRALVLVAANRASEALTILDYPNYERGSATSREERELARAFAFKQLHRPEEHAHALQAARRFRRTECAPLNSIIESRITGEARR